MNNLDNVSEMAILLVTFLNVHVLTTMQCISQIMHFSKHVLGYGLVFVYRSQTAVRPMS